MLVCLKEHPQWKEHQIRENDQLAKANICDWLPQCWHRSAIMEVLWWQKWRPCIGPIDMGQLELDEEPVPEDDRAADAEDLD